MGTRLGLGFGLVCLLLAAAVGIGLWGQSRADASSGRAKAATQLRVDAITAKFRTADFAGWQTGYAFDALRGVPDATSDTAGQRKEFLTSTAAFRQDLATLSASAVLTDAQRATLEQLQQSFDAFMGVDEKIIAGYREGNAAGIARSNALASGEALQWMTKIVQATDDLVATATAAAQTAEAEAATASRDARYGMIAAGLVCLLLAAVLAVVVTRTITQPLVRTVATLRRVADRDLTARVDPSGRDELAELGRAVDDTLDRLRNSFQAIMRGGDSVAAAAQQLTHVSANMGRAAGDTSNQSEQAASASEEISRSVQAVAAGTEELNAAINEIASNASEAAQVAQLGVEGARQARDTISQLGESSAEIGKVVSLITSIAEQTNLLALNATIEAARAGELGKGFAVVAGEVKDLAQATAKATEDIATRVETIQADTTAAVTAISSVDGIINRINDFSTTIAAAVEEQTATALEMSRGITEAAGGSTRVADSIQAVAAGAQLTSNGSEEAHQTAQELSRVAADLRAQITQFRV